MEKPNICKGCKYEKVLDLEAELAVHKRALEIQEVNCHACFRYENKPSYTECGDCGRGVSEECCRKCVREDMALMIEIRADVEEALNQARKKVE